MFNKLWILAEQNGGVIAESFHEMLSKVRELYPDAASSARVTAVLLDADQEAAEALRNSGADEVLVVVDARLGDYNPAYYTAALTEAVKAYRPDAMLVSASEIGSEVAPSVAARLNTGLIAHCANLQVDSEGELRMLVPAFGGKLLGENTIPEARPAMASIKPGTFERAPQARRNAEMTVFTPHLDGVANGIELVERVTDASEELPIERAEIVVCAGLGCAASGNLDKAKELARRIGASMCYTRPLSDLGYYPDERAMVGSSGKTIKPRLYIGIGVSGAGQHVCGMKDSGTIININSDESALSFDVSNYKVVGDCGTLLDALLDQL